MFNTPILVGFGIAFVHVLSGPDHLAAVAPLVVNSQHRQWKIGLLWGVGHILGMSLIGLLFLFFKGIIPLEIISAHSEQLVGAVLIMVGLWTIYKIKSQNKTHNHPHIHKQPEEYIHIHTHQHTKEINHQHTHSIKNNKKQSASIFIGIIHGFAGISHFILFSPILSFHSNTDGFLYIIGFSLGTMVSMSLFAYLLGILTMRTQKKHTANTFNYIRWTAGILAIVVGIYWITIN